jgi:5-methylthioadenosine/S-adenosylhomocysteine deaminase
VSETPFDREATLKTHGSTDAEMMEEIGLAAPDTLMVHCVFLTERDRRMAAANGVKVSHNAASNMYLSSGVAPVPAMLAQGICVGLGLDGAASNNSQDMLELMKLTALLHKVSSRDPTVITAERVLEMATIDGARCLGMEAEIGSIEEGKRADLVVFDPKRSPKAVPLHNPASTVVYSSSDRNVEAVMVDGRMLIEGGVFVGGLGEDRILAQCQRAAEELVRLGGIENRMAAHRWRSTAY